MTQQIDPAQLAAFRRAVRANIQREIEEERAVDDLEDEALVARAVEREMRRQRAEGDVAILRSAGAADDLDDLVAWSAIRAVAEG